MSQRVGALLAAFILLFAGSQAAAQRGGDAILFLDQQRVLSESKAGLSIDAQLRTLAEKAAAELQATEKALDEEARSLQASKDSLSEEDFGQRYNALINKVRNHEQLKQIRQAELTRARTNAVAELAQAWDPIIRDIFQKRKATVLLERQAVLEANEKSDITGDVIAALDKKVSTVNVVQPDLRAEMIAAQQAQAAQAMQLNQ